MKYPAVNRYFTFAVFAAPPVAGSAVSFLYNGGALLAFLDIARGRRALSGEPHFRATVVALYAYCAAILAATLVNPNALANLPGQVGLLSLLLFPFAYSTWRISDRDQIVEACLAASAAAGIGGMLLAMAQFHLLGIHRAEGGSGNALVFGYTIALAGSVALAGAFRHRGRRRAVFAAAFLASAVAVAYSASRGPFMLVLINAVLVALAMSRGRRAGVAALGMLGLLFVAILFVVSDISPLAGRLRTMAGEVANALGGEDFTTSGGLRVALWRSGIDLWLEKPFLGHGERAIPRLIAETMQRTYGIAAGLTHFHNVFINTLVAGGVVALLALLATIAIPAHAALRTLLRTDDDNARFGATLLVAFFSMFVFAGMTNLVLHHDIMDAVFMSFLAVGLFLATGDTVPETTPDRP